MRDAVPAATTAGLESLAAVAAALRAAGCVFAEEEASVLLTAARTQPELAALVARRAAGEPLEHVAGWAEFAGLRVTVGPGVFVPRRRTEFLARVAAGLARAADAGPGLPVLIDLCCGSGAIAMAVASALGGMEIHAVDSDRAAADCARRNLGPAGGQVYQGDLFAPLPPALRGRTAVITANVPYVPTAELAALPPEARDHEPATALDGGADGLGTLRRVAGEAAGWLAPGGSLVIEVTARQAEPAAGIIARGGLRPRLETDAELDATVVVGTRAGEAG